MAISRRAPLRGAPTQGRARLGELLQDRRQELGYGDSRNAFEEYTRDAFGDDARLDARTCYELENAKRDSFKDTTLKRAARAYGIAYESLLDVAWGRADELTPAVTAHAGAAAAAGTAPQPRAAAGLPPAPPSGLIRDEAVYPWAVPIWTRILDLVDQGVTDPDGERLGLSPDDAKVWDGTRGMSLADRAWTVGEVQRRRDARNTERRNGATSA